MYTEGAAVEQRLSVYILSALHQQPPCRCRPAAICKQKKGAINVLAQMSRGRLLQQDLAPECCSTGFEALNMIG